VSALLDLAYLGALAAASPYLAWKVASRPRHLDGFRQRLGNCEPRVGDAPCAWVHGVSVGEVVAAQPLIESVPTALREGGRDSEVVISTTTSSGQEVARRRFPGRRVVYYPFDFSWSVRRVFDALRPSIVVLVELELWPNFLREAQRRKIPVVVVNGRISEKSFRGYRLARRIIPLQAVARYCVQTDEYASRFERLGVDPRKIVVTGSMKYDVVRTGGVDAAAMRTSLGLAADEIVWICGSTHPGEERAIGEIHARLKARWPKLRLVLAPRHIERSAEVARELEQTTREKVVRRSVQSQTTGPLGPGILLVDTIGELGKLYAAADLVFVGGSLIPHGGQNILEPAGLGKAVLMGPHTFNFQESVERLLRAQAAVEVPDAAGLEREVASLLGDPTRARALGQSAHTAIEAAKGATARTLSTIGELFRGNVSAAPQAPARKLQKTG
jgi:3-deoxy-D-manno-octulosonic-acid transferase